MKRYADYDAFAWLYNREWGAFGSNIFPALKILAGDNLSNRAKILDLCCGTGQLAKVLTEKGYRVTGIDGSAEMLHYAKENALAAKFILNDARTFKLPPEYSAVFSTFDSLNHVMSLIELQQVFKNVFECLVKGGIFVFDMNMQKHFELHNGFINIQDRPEYLFLQRPGYDAEKKLGQYKFTMFQSEGKLWKRSEITLYQTWYLLEDIVSSLGKVGFTSITSNSFNPQREFEEASKDSDRVFFYAQKP